MAGSGGWAEIIPEGEPREIDVTVAHPARIYDYWLGGKNNFAADREAAEATLAVNPNSSGVRANREFLASAVGFLAGEAGVRQFLDVGTGLPTGNNTHEAAHSVAPDARVVYVDNDPIVMAHARALLTGEPGTTDYVYADLRDPETILREAARTLDFGRPVAIVLLMILMHISDEDRPHELVARPLDAVPRAAARRSPDRRRRRCRGHRGDQGAIQPAGDGHAVGVAHSQTFAEALLRDRRAGPGDHGPVAPGARRANPAVSDPRLLRSRKEALRVHHHSFGIMDFDFPNGWRFHLTGGAPAPMIDPMWPRGPIPVVGAAGVPAAAPVGPAMTTLRSVIASLASMIRCAGSSISWSRSSSGTRSTRPHAWRLAAPALAVAWAAAVDRLPAPTWPRPLPPAWTPPFTWRSRSARRIRAACCP